MVSSPEGKSPKGGSSQWSVISGQSEVRRERVRREVVISCQLSVVSSQWSVRSP